MTPMDSPSGQQRLRHYIDRIETLEEEKTALADDIRQLYADAKGEGFDSKIMRKVIRLRKVDDAKRYEEEQLLELYEQALRQEAASTAASPEEAASDQSNVVSLGGPA